jgi:UDP-N-acetylmuramoylalanine--D-glutamate ligase
LDLSCFKNKRILLVGYGREAKSTIAFLERHNFDCMLSVADKKQLEDLPSGVNGFFGESYLESLPYFDFVFKSPGVPGSELETYFRSYPNSVLTSGTAIFLAKHRDKVIGVTGTKGKSTTSSLIAHLLGVAGKRVILAGNIGLPALDVFDEDSDYFVLEMSSYQLEDLDVSPSRAVFLNIYEEHLDYHKTFDSYLKAKANIGKFQKEGDLIILPRGNETILSSLQGALGRKSFYGIGEQYFVRDDHIFSSKSSAAICAVSELPIKGLKNLENVLACVTLLNEFEIPVGKLKEGLLSFKPLKHRLEEVGTIDDVLFVNDSIATVPEACMSAIDVYQDTLDTIILGGFDRGLDFSKLAEKVISTRISNIILFMPSGARIRSAIESSRNFNSERIKFFEVDNMTSVIEIAKNHTRKGGTCLLSPASPSFPIFKNFEERGDRFRYEVDKYI